MSCSGTIRICTCVQDILFFAWEAQADVIRWVFWRCVHGDLCILIIIENDDEWNKEAT